LPDGMEEAGKEQEKEEDKEEDLRQLWTPTCRTACVSHGRHGGRVQQ